jgi:4'-phosphopantetheinyl transferase
MTLYPVVMPVGAAVRRLSGREKVAALSEFARAALRVSADRAGIALGELSQDDEGVPLPAGNYVWSVSHKPRYVAAVAGQGTVGIDVEEIRPRRKDIFPYVAGDAEWALFGGRSWDSLYRCWTAKEAVVKSAGTGLAGLKSCRVLDVPDGASVTLSYRGREYDIAQLRHDSHVTAVIRDGRPLEWVVLD